MFTSPLSLPPVGHARAPGGHGAPAPDPAAPEAAPAADLPGPLGQLTPLGRHLLRYSDAFHDGLPLAGQAELEQELLERGRALQAKARQTGIRQVLLCGRSWPSSSGYRVMEGLLRTCQALGLHTIAVHAPASRVAGFRRSAAALLNMAPAGRSSGQGRMQMEDHVRQERSPAFALTVQYLPAVMEQAALDGQGLRVQHLDDWPDAPEEDSDIRLQRMVDRFLAGDPAPFSVLELGLDDVLDCMALLRARGLGCEHLVYLHGLGHNPDRYVRPMDGENAYGFARRYRQSALRTGEQPALRIFC